MSLLQRGRSTFSRTIVPAALVALACAVLCLPATLVAQGADGRASAEVEAAVRVPLDAYLRGHATGDSAAFRRAFWKEARLHWVRDGQLATRTADEYIAGAGGRPADDEPQRKRRIVSVHIAGNAASAVIELDYPATHFIDYMSLLKIGDEWRIIHKTFYAAPRARP